MVGPGALKPSDGNIKLKTYTFQSLRGQHCSYIVQKAITALIVMFTFFFSFLDICTYIGVYNNNNNNNKR